VTTTDAADAPFLQLADVTKRYGTKVVLDHVTLDVGEHQVVCLIGASGSGKSTLLRCINGLEQIQGGEVRIDGQLVSGPWTDLELLRQRVGIVFQSYNLFPHMTVERNITLAPRKLRGLSRADAKAQALHLLDRIGLADRAGAYPDQLSGGQQQRVAIVRALAMEPQVLLLDEITAALDPELVAEVLAIVRELADNGMTMLLATHEMSFARECADLVCFLDAGRILEKGPPAQVFSDPVEARTRTFLRRIIEAGRL
jgi:polar amino acid transport system ATP-binding protein